MQIFVKPYYRTLTLDVRPTDTVAIVKSMIHYRTEALEDSVPPALTDEPLLRGQTARQDDRTLADYSVRNLARLTFGINLSGKRPTTGHPPAVPPVSHPNGRVLVGLLLQCRARHTIRDLKMMVLAREGIVCTCLRLARDQDWVYWKPYFRITRARTRCRRFVTNSGARARLEDGD